MGISPGQYKPHIRIRYVYHPPAWIVVPLIQKGHMNLIEAVPFLLLCLIGLFVAGRFFWSVQEKEIAYSRGEMVPV